MSKCKAVLDGDKITKIHVKAKQDNPQSKPPEKKFLVEKRKHPANNPDS